MPTRITIREEASKSHRDSPRLRTTPAFHLGLPRNVAPDDDAMPSAAVSPTSSGRIGTLPSSARSSRVMGFRSSILREISGRMNESELENFRDAEQDPVRISTNDIRASPRLLGYLFCTIAAGVMLVSVMKLYHDELSSEILPDNTKVNTNKFFIASTGLIYRWKLWGAIYMACKWPPFVIHFFNKK